MWILNAALLFQFSSLKVIYKHYTMADEVVAEPKPLMGVRGGGRGGHQGMKRGQFERIIVSVWINFQSPLINLLWLYTIY